MITIADIARKVGVSRPTVSMVLNNTDSRVRISQKTRQRVLEVADELGYCRNEVAASFRKGRTRVIGVVGYFEDSFTLPILNGITHALGEQDYSIKIHPRKLGDEDHTSIIRACIGSRLAGVIAIDMISISQVRNLRDGLAAGDIPLMLADSVEGDHQCVNVVSHDAQGIAQTMTYLHDLGHRRIAHVTLAEPFAHRRRQAFLDAASDHDLPIGPDDVHPISTAMSVTARDKVVLEQVLRRYTAAICLSDYIAMKMLRVASLLDLRVPADFSVAGFADLEFSALATPALTTVAQPFRAIGQKAAKLMLDHIQGRPVEPRTHRLPVRFMERDSCRVASPRRIDSSKLKA